MRRWGHILLAGLALALTAAARADDKALGPFGTQAAPAAAAPSGGMGVTTLLGILLLAGARSAANRAEWSDPLRSDNGRILAAVDR